MWREGCSGELTRWRTRMRPGQQLARRARTGRGARTTSRASLQEWQRGEEMSSPNEHAPVPTEVHPEGVLTRSRLRETVQQPPAPSLPSETVTIDVKGAALAMGFAALFTAGLAVWAVLSVLLPALRAMENASRQLESAASAVERCAEDTRNAAVPSFQSVESASREWQVVGEEVRALGIALSGPSAAVNRVGNDVSSVAGALQSWQERMSEAISAALATRRLREGRIRRARSAQAWIDSWRMRRSKEQAGMQLPESSVESSNASRTGRDPAKGMVQLGNRAKDVYHTAVGSIAQWWNNRRIGRGKRDGGAVETSVVAVRSNAVSDKQEALTASIAERSEVATADGDGYDSALQQASEAYTESSAATRMLLGVTTNGDEEATPKDVEYALEAAEEAIDHASAASARLREAVFEKSEDDEEYRDMKAMDGSYAEDDVGWVIGSSGESKARAGENEKANEEHEAEEERRGEGIMCSMLLFSLPVFQ